jgi:predicted ATP-dependent serine protease
MALLTEQIVGRADELGSLEDELAELGKGRAAVVELVGEPGIGKTRLLAELAARAAARGYLVLSGSASGSSVTSRSGCSWTRSTSTSRPSSRAA